MENLQLKDQYRTIKDFDYWSGTVGDVAMIVDDPAVPLLRNDTFQQKVLALDHHASTLRRCLLHLRFLCPVLHDTSLACQIEDFSIHQMHMLL